MIIWKGLGILVGVAGILGLIAGGLAGAAMGLGGFSLGLGLVFAALANWGLWKLIYPKQPRVQIDPATGRQVIHRPNHSFFFIPAKAWTWIFAVLALPAGAFGVFVEKAGKEEAAKPGHAEFQAADNFINFKASDIAHGNSKEAEAAAVMFAQAMKGMSAEAFSGAKKPDADFPTYCQHGQDTIAFLCHVPELRNYKSAESKDGLAKIAWMTAKLAAATLDPEQRKSLVVGLRGITGYSIILHGSPADETPVTAGIAEKSALLYPPFTTTHAAPASPQP